MSQETGDLHVCRAEVRGGQHTSVSARPGSNWPFSEDLKKLSSMELTACIQILALTSTCCTCCVIFDPEPPFPCLECIGVQIIPRK